MISCTPFSPSGARLTSKPSAPRYSARSSVRVSSSSTNNTRLMGVSFRSTGKSAVSGCLKPACAYLNSIVFTFLARLLRALRFFAKRGGALTIIQLRNIRQPESVGGAFSLSGCLKNHCAESRRFNTSAAPLPRQNRRRCLRAADAGRGRFCRCGCRRPVPAAPMRRKCWRARPR